MNKYLDETGLAYFWGKIKSAMPAAQVLADWNLTNTSAADYIKNKPSIPTIPDLVKGTTTGNGNAVTDMSVSGHTITLTKGTTFLTSHQDISGKLDKVAKLGSTINPVYTSAAGTFAQCSTYAGGTKVTLNGSDKGGSTASFYAPTAVGTSGYVLTSNGSGAPSWNALPTLSKGSTSGSGNAVTDISVSGHTITLTKGSTFLTSHLDISSKEDKFTIVTKSSGTSLSAEVGKYYNFTYDIGTLAITLPTPTGNYILLIVFFFNTSTDVNVTFSSTGNTIYYSEDFSIDSSTRYEVNALWNGNAWVIGALKIQ